jgi:WD40 repeat protein
MIFLQGARQLIDHLQFSPDGRALAAPCASGLQLWTDPPCASPKPQFIRSSKLTSVLFIPGGSQVLLESARPRIVELATGKKAIRFPARSRYFALSPDGRSVLFAHDDAGGGRRLSCYPLSDQGGFRWSIGTPRLICSPPLFLPDGQRFVLFERLYSPRTLGDDIPVYLTRDARTGIVATKVIKPLKDGFLHPVLSPDRRLLAARRNTWIAVFPSADLGAEPLTIRNDNLKQFTGLAFHPSGRLLGATSNDGTVKLYDTTTWKLAHAFDWGIGRLRSIAFSQDGMLAAAGGGKGQIVLWDVDL